MKKLTILMMLFFALSAVAQTLPEAPNPKTETIQHRFFDARNNAVLVVSAGAIIGDSLSTQNFLTYKGFYELNPIARPFVGSRKGQAFISGAGFGAEVGTMYLLHKLGWHRLERIFPVAVAVVEMYWIRNNTRITRGLGPGR